MNLAEYRSHLSALGLPPTGALTGRLLGVSQRQLAYYSRGQCPVARPVAHLLRLLRRIAGAAPLPPAFWARLAAELEGSDRDVIIGNSDSGQKIEEGNGHAQGQEAPKGAPSP